MKKNSLTLLIILCLGVIITTYSSGTVAPGKQWLPGSGRTPLPGDEYLNEMDGTVLVWIPGGEFSMGSNADDADARPVHKQKINGFWMGKYEVTNEQYAKFLMSGADSWHKTPYMTEEEFNNPKQPVTGIRFYDCLSYCEWSGLRMPTEAEWEYAAAAGNKQLKYPTQNGSINHDLANYAGTGGRDLWLETPAPVGSFPPNPFGLYDMAGNVWEWTSSLYVPYPYSPYDGREDLEVRNFRVMRGGAWEFSEVYCASSNRHQFAMHLRYDFCGMRLAKSYKAQ